MRIVFRSILTSLIVSLLFSPAFVVAADQTIVLKAARMFDGKSKALVQNGVIIVQGNKIVDVGSNLPVPDGATRATISPLCSEKSAPFKMERIVSPWP